MRLELATQNDFDAIIAFYDDVTERTSEMATYARWSKGKHPTIEGIRAYINEGSMYLYRNNGKIVGAMAVTMYQSEDYHAIDWSQQVADDEVAVIHILAVPTFADVDKEYQHALTNGAASVLPPTTEPWGQRTCYVADPDGNLIEIGSFTE